jgi:hypothetical protein
MQAVQLEFGFGGEDSDVAPGGVATEQVGGPGAGRTSHCWGRTMWTMGRP